MGAVRKKLLLIILILLTAGILAGSTHIPGVFAAVAPIKGDNTPYILSANDAHPRPELTGQRPADTAVRSQPSAPHQPGQRELRSAASNGDAQAAPLMATCSSGFFLLAIAVYLSRKRMNIRIPAEREKQVLMGLFTSALLLRLGLAYMITGHPFDLNFFKSWADSAANDLFGFYSITRCDYPPLYIYILAAVGKIASLPALVGLRIVLLKLPSIAADLAASYLIFRLAKKKDLSLTASLGLCTFYLYNPAVLINSSIWGQVDSFFAFLITCSLILLTEGRVALSSAGLMISVLMKPQGIIFLPVLFYELLRMKNPRSWLTAIAAALIAGFILVLPFSLCEGPLWIYDLYAKTLGEYPYASVNAFNFFSLTGANYVQDGVKLFLLSYHSWGMIFIVLVTAATGFLYMKKSCPQMVPAAALLQITGVFLFSARMHERYLFPAAILGILAYIYMNDKRLLFLSAAFSATIYVNTHTVLFATLAGAHSIAYTPALVICSLANVLLFGYLVNVLFDIAVHAK